MVRRARAAHRLGSASGRRPLRGDVRPFAPQGDRPPVGNRRRPTRKPRRRFRPGRGVSCSVPDPPSPAPVRANGARGTASGGPEPPPRRGESDRRPRGSPPGNRPGELARIPDVLVAGRAWHPLVGSTVPVRGPVERRGRPSVAGSRACGCGRVEPEDGPPRDVSRWPSRVPARLETRWPPDGPARRLVRAASRRRGAVGPLPRAGRRPADGTARGNAGDCPRGVGGREDDVPRAMGRSGGPSRRLSSRGRPARRPRSGDPGSAPTRSPSPTGGGRRDPASRTGNRGTRDGRVPGPGRGASGRRLEAAESGRYRPLLGVPPREDLRHLRPARARDRRLPYRPLRPAHEP